MENYKILQEKYDKVALKFLQIMKKKYKIVCMLLTGSYYTKKLNKKSDLDVFLITKNSSNLRIKGVSFVNGIKVSYFLNPYKKIVRLLNSERGKLKRPTAEYVYFSDCLIGKGEAGFLKKIAKRTIKSLIIKIDIKERLYLGWKLYDKLEIFKRKDYNSLNKEYLKFDLFDLSIGTFFFIKRSYKPHAKYVLNRIKILDKIFYKKVKTFLKERSNSKLANLAAYVLKLLGFNKKDYFKKTKAKT
ncbi:MAG: nucleotidyltransferase domain-containing protein [Patescibacteria group bacterium]